MEYLVACIPLLELEVLPTYRNQGIGHTLVRRMLEILSDIYRVEVDCDPALHPFYDGPLADHVDTELFTPSLTYWPL
jgi:GNAT superfamily N-acetyltransferase